jgi:hypothetical protein
VREYLTVLDDAAFGGATPDAPKHLAVADLGGVDKSARGRDDHPVCFFAKF